MAYGLRFLNTDEGKGETNYLDLQANLYKRKYVMDVFVQLYDGFFLSNTNALNQNYKLPFLFKARLKRQIIWSVLFKRF